MSQIVEVKKITIDDRIAAGKQYTALLDYLAVKVDRKDWHGVRDACVDIEILVAVHPWLEERKKVSTS